MNAAYVHRAPPQHTCEKPARRSHRAATDSVGLVLVLGLCFGLVAGCSRTGKQEIPLSKGQRYVLQSSGKMSVFAGDGAPGAQPLDHLRVKRKNENPTAKAPGCWACTDCICNTADCACTECTSC